MRSFTFWMCHNMHATQEGSELTAGALLEHPLPVTGPGWPPATSTKIVVRQRVLSADCTIVQALSQFAGACMHRGALATNLRKAAVDSDCSPGWAAVLATVGCRGAERQLRPYAGGDGAAGAPPAAAKRHTGGRRQEPSQRHCCCCHAVPMVSDPANGQGKLMSVDRRRCVRSEG